MTFVEFAQARGLLVERVIADGRVHRCRTTDKPGKKNGAYLFDGRSGFVQNWATDSKAVAYRAEGEPDIGRPDISAIIRARDEARRLAQESAALRAKALISAAQWMPHPYLERKGFQRECGFVHDGRLIVPMWDGTAYGKKLNSVQRISGDGTKKFLPGGRAKGSIFRIGSGAELWHCEGYATGLSIRAALQTLHRRATVVVCFSAGNLVEVARSGYVVADQDASGAGEAAAKATGLPWFMPPEGDANDMHLKFGAQALGNSLRQLLSRPTKRAA